MAADQLTDLRLITSRQNALVKELRRAFQNAELTPDGYCAVEGVRTIEEAIRSGLRFKAVFFSESARARAQKLLPQLSKHTERILLADEIFESAVATETPQGVAALVQIREWKLEDVLSRAENPLLIAPLGIQDPGNLGTIVRSAEAFGSTAVLVGEGTVSQFNAKAVRASAGSLFRLPVVRVRADIAISELRTRKFRVLGTSSHEGTSLQAASLTGPIAIFVGSEGSGLSRNLLQSMDELLEIPHVRKVESLNAGVAASIVLYEAARQRVSSTSEP